MVALNSIMALVTIMIIKIGNPNSASTIQVTVLVQKFKFCVKFAHFLRSGFYERLISKAPRVWEIYQSIFWTRKD